MRRFFMVASILLLATIVTRADENLVGKYNIGGAAGFVTGYGLSYRQWFGKSGAQVTFAPYYMRNSDQYYNNKDMSFSIGVTGLRIIKQAKYVNLIGYFGPHFWYSREEYEYSWRMVPDQSIEPTRNLYIQRILFIGGGPGFDIHFWKISFNLMCGYVYMTDFADQDGAHFTGEAAIYYSF